MKPPGTRREAIQCGVRYVAASCCTGDEALKRIAEIYGETFIRSGAGRVIAVGGIG